MSTTEEPQPPSPPESDSPPSPVVPTRLDPLVSEFLVVLSFAYLPTFAMSVFYAYAGSSAYGHTVISPLRQLGYVAQMAQMTIPLLYIFRINKGVWSDIGLSKPRWSDLPWGILLLFLGWIAYYGVFTLIYKLLPNAAEWARQYTIQVPRGGPKSFADYLAILAASLSVGFGEELFFRSYMISRWTKISRSAPQALAVATLLFAINHAYEGLSGVLSAAILGVVYAFAFLKLRRLWPLVLAHAITDFISLSRM